MTGHILSERYQVHERALSFDQACALDVTLAAPSQMCTLSINEARMLDCLARLGREVKIVIEPARRKAVTGHVEVGFACPPGNPGSCLTGQKKLQKK